MKKTFIIIFFLCSFISKGQYIIQDWQPDSVGCTSPLVLQSGQASITSYREGFETTSQSFTSPNWIVFEIPIIQQEELHTISFKYVSSGNIRISWMGIDNMGHTIKIIPSEFEPTIATISFKDRNAIKLSFNMYQAGSNWMTIDDLFVDVNQPTPISKLKVIENKTLIGYKILYTK